MTTFRTSVLLMLMLAAAVCLVGCEKRVVRNTWAEFARDTGASVGGKQRERTTRPGDDIPVAQGNVNGWSIPLQRFEGSGRDRNAKTLVAQIKKTDAGQSLPFLWLDDRHGVTTVQCGRYPAANAPEALSALEMVQRIELEQVQPFAGAMVEPLSAADKVALDPFDLRGYHGLYSLQIAVFDPQGGKKFRSAAEAYVQQLREAGDKAFYYHGPNRSMVTVGLFHRDEAFITEDNPLSPGTQIDRYSPAVVTLREKFPRNLYNGYTVVEKQGGEVLGDQESALIRVP